MRIAAWDAVRIAARRQGRVEAVAVIHYDGPRVSNSVLAELRRIPAVRFVRAVEIG